MLFCNLKLFDTNKRYRFIMGSRSNGKRYMLYKVRSQYLEIIGETVRRGFCDKITPQNESIVNYAFVEMIKAQERFRLDTLRPPCYTNSVERS